ncbi:54S ribosomal protein L17, mitochondrial [[Candida] anglica]
MIGRAAVRSSNGSGFNSSLSLRAGSMMCYSTQSSAISSTLLLSRNPVITSDVPKFEAQYYKYQNELWKRLMWTFPSWFYFKKGTISEVAYRELNPPPVFNNPRIEFPKGRPVIVHQRDRRFKQEIKVPKSYKDAKAAEEGEEAGATSGDSSKGDSMSRQVIPNSRTTEADKTNDLKSLERKLARTLYLTVKPQGKWILPNFPEETASEEVKPLHTLAEEGLYKLGGSNINYFNVSKTPCHVYKGDSAQKEYIIKSHILAGIFEPQTADLDFKWLTKEELKDTLDKSYYQDIEHLLSDV